MVPARYCLQFLPPPPPTTNAVQPDADAAAVFLPAPGSSEDRVSQLPQDIQRAIVSKLTVADGAATVVLSSSWRSIWSSNPLVLDDAQLRPEGLDEIEADDNDDKEVMEAVEISRALVGEKVTAILRRHPGPFRSVRLTSSPASSLRAWLRIMAAKGVEELVVLNCEWPTAMMLLSVELLRCQSLKHLHLALAQMPHLTAPGRGGRPGRRRAVHFPNLQQLVLCHAFVPEGDIADFLAGCPVLEMLAFIEGYGVPQYIHVLCPRLKCLLLWQFNPLKLTVDAPRIERVILWRTNHFLPPRTRIIVRRAPNLRILGYLDPKLHVLESGDIVIEAGTRPKPDVMLPSVEILAIKIRFGVRDDERTLLAYLRVFPNIRTLHIQSAPAPPRPANEHGPDFWNNDMFNLITCISKIKKFSFYDFHGMDNNNSEILFIKSIAQTCNLLEHMRITISGSIMEPPNWLKARLMNSMCEVEWASEASTLDIIVGNQNEWEYRTASDMSLGDPFEFEDRYAVSDIYKGRGPSSHCQGSHASDKVMATEVQSGPQQHRAIKPTEKEDVVDEDDAEK